MRSRSRSVLRRRRSRSRSEKRKPPAHRGGDRGDRDRDRKRERSRDRGRDRRSPPRERRGYGSPPRGGGGRDYRGGEGRDGGSREDNRRSGGGGGGTSLLIRNIADRTNVDDIRYAFERYGGIKDIYIPMDFRTKKPKPFAFCEFFKSEDASVAKNAMDHRDLGGRQVFFQFLVP